MKTLITSALLVLSHSIFAHFENVQITTVQGKTVEALVDVYAPGVIVGNTETLVCIIDNDTVDVSLDRVASLKLGSDEYHVITLTDHDVDLFDEPAVISHSILAKLVVSGTVSLYDYYYSGNSRFDNGKPNKNFGKSLHKRSVLRSKKGATVVFKSTYKSVMKSYFPDLHNDLQYKYPQLVSAVTEGNQILSRN